MSLQEFRSEAAIPLSQSVAKQLAGNRLCYLLGAQLKQQLPFFNQASWQEFAASWNSLCLDGFMKDKGKYRLRRFSEWEFSKGARELKRIPPRPYVQPLYINPLNGGIDRTFEPFEERVIQNAFFNGLVKWCLEIFEQLEGASDWEVQVFQNRIITTAGMEGLPTPEGAHRDGVTYILMMLIGRENVVGGETTIYDMDKNELGKLTLLHPMDCVLANDEQVMHGVTPIQPGSASDKAHRDMLIAMFTRRSPGVSV